VNNSTEFIAFGTPSTARLRVCHEERVHFLTAAALIDGSGPLLFLFGVFKKVERIVTCVGDFLFSEQILLAGLGGSNFSAIFTPLVFC